MFSDHAILQHGLHEHFSKNLRNSFQMILFFFAVMALHGIKPGLSSFLETSVCFFIPPYTSEMNPIKQICKELRKLGFRNEVFATLEKVVDRLCSTISSLTSASIHNTTARAWTLSCFN